MPNAVLQQRGTPVTFRSVAGTVAFSPGGTDYATGHQSALWDRGDAPQAEDYEWRAKVMLVAGGGLGQTIDFYMATSDGAITDGDVTAGNVAFTDSDALPNMLWMGSVVVDNTAGTTINASGVFSMTGQLGVLVLWNNTTAETLAAGVGDHEVIVTPVYPEVQDA